MLSQDNEKRNYAKFNAKGLSHSVGCARFCWFEPIRGHFERAVPFATAESRVGIADSLSGIGAQEWQVAATALASDAQMPTSIWTRGSTFEISVRAANLQGPGLVAPSISIAL